MQMTNEEICRSYRQAKHRQNQIKILADLNQTSVKEIRKILIDNGALHPKKVQRQVICGDTETSEPLKKPVSEPVPAEWKTSLKAVTERIVELKIIRDNAEKELSEIYQTLGALCEKE